MKKNRAIFLDRDGTINEEVGYIERLDRLVIIPAAFEAIRLINLNGFKAVVVTNQAGIAKGLFNEAFVMQTNERLQEFLRQKGAAIDAFYFCPHHPTEGVPLTDRFAIAANRRRDFFIRRRGIWTLILPDPS